MVRLQHAIATVGAKRVVRDTIESLFGGLPNLLVFAPSCGVRSVGSRIVKCGHRAPAERPDSTRRLRM
ncbi:MAG TPA: hypothetical protein VMK12_21195 [Anaeromyxobacteraceae bacterium]|nr:hypothetical protein [Anaeromyxobacteraceae bacterium]